MDPAGVGAVRPRSFPFVKNDTWLAPGVILWACVLVSFETLSATSTGFTQEQSRR